MTAPSVAETGYYHKTLGAITGRGRSEIHGPFRAHYPRSILFIWVLACGSGVCFLINPLLVYNWLGNVLQSKLSSRTVSVGLPGQPTSDNCERCVMRCSDCKHTQAAPSTRAEMIPPPGLDDSLIMWRVRKRNDRQLRVYTCRIRHSTQENLSPVEVQTS